MLVLAAVVLFLTNRTKPLALQTGGPAPMWQVHFSPSGEAAVAVIEAIDHTRSRILVQSYSFTSEAIAQGLVRAW